jgi:alkylation response protein AidB-like acyl-CoA dehydrogenase
MPIAVTEDHEALRQTAARWLVAHCPPSVPRAVAEAGADGQPAGERAPWQDVWTEMAAQGWLGLHIPEPHGGQGFTLAELAVVVEELGHALFPGPLLPTLLVSALLARHAGTSAYTELLAGLADGSTTGAVALSAEPLAAEPGPAGSMRLSGTVRPVLGLPAARLVVVPVLGGHSGDGVRWCLLDREECDATTRVESLPVLDGTRPAGVLQAEGLIVPAHGSFQAGEVRGLLYTLAAAESAGLARWALETASDYAKVRVQFGRPIGQFQAVTRPQRGATPNQTRPNPTAGTSARGSPGRSPSRAPHTAPNSASRRWAASDSPGSTMRTST